MLIKKHIVVQTVQLSNQILFFQVGTFKSNLLIMVSLPYKVSLFFLFSVFSSFQYCLYSFACEPPLLK